MDARGYRVCVEARRGKRVESEHLVYAAFVGAPPDTQLEHNELPRTSMRSTAKPFQLLPLVARGGVARFGLQQADLALMAASHHGTPQHAERVARILERIGLRADDLRCGLHRPYFLDALPVDDAANERIYGPLHHNCSGNHAGLLALALLVGDRPAEYLDSNARGQQQALWGVEALCGETPAILEDNCGSPCYDLPLAAMAQAYRFLAAPESARALAGRRRRLLEGIAPIDAIVDALARIAAAMSEAPQWVSGEHSAATRLARMVPPLVLKHGAEGMLCAALPRHGTSVALKVADGNSRAALPALLYLLDRFGWLESDAAQAARDLLEPPLFGHRGQIVGSLRVRPVM